MKLFEKIDALTEVEDMLEVVGVTYEMERMMRPPSGEVH